MFRPLQDTQQVLGSLQDEMNKMFERVWHVGVSTAPLDGQQWAPPVDLYEYDDRYVLFAELPGLAASSIEVHQVGDRVTLRGEKRKPEAAGDAIGTVRKECRYGQFCRTIELPPGTAADRISAKVNSGILEVTVPKTEANKPKTIRVQQEDKAPGFAGFCPPGGAPSARAVTGDFSDLPGEVGRRGPN